MMINMENGITNHFRRFNIDTKGGNHELFCREFSYAAIFGNLRVSNLHDILKLLEISRLPNLLFMIQMDNRHRMYSAFPEYSAYPLLYGIVQAVQDRLKKLGIENVVSTFIGHWTIGAFLYIGGDTMSDEDTKARVTNVASDLIDYVYERTNEEISIGVSDFCTSQTQYPRAYTECKTALSFAFFSGKRSIEIYDKRKPQPDITKSDFTRIYFTHFINYLDKNNVGACLGVAEDMIAKFRKANVLPITSRLLLARLFGRVTDYYTDAGLDQGELSLIAQDSVVEILNCGFLGEMPRIVVKFCGQINELLAGSRQSPDERFKHHVNDCIERHSSDYLFGLNSIASLSSYSPSYFSRLFTRVYGVPFSQYLASYRVEKAKNLLKQESMTLNEIARKAGFCSTSYFCSVFRKKTGKSPRQYSSEERAGTNGRASEAL